MKCIGLIVSSLLIACCTCSHSWASSACLVSGLEGKAAVLHDKDQSQPINTFKKLWPGDIVELADDSTIMLNYLAYGRIEKWRGPARIVIEERGGADQTKNQQPTLVNLGGLAADLKNSKLLTQQNTSGQIAVRGARHARYENAMLDQPGKEKLQQIQAQYATSSQDARKGDVTADLYYLAALENLGQKDAMARHIYKLLSMNGSSPELEEMLNAL